MRQLQEQLGSSLLQLHQARGDLQWQVAPQLPAVEALVRTSASLPPRSAVDTAALRTVLEPFNDPAWQ